MSFERLQKWITYGVVVFGLLPLALSGEIPPPVLVLSFGAVLASWFYTPPRQRGPTSVRAWNFVTVAAFAVLALLGQMSGNWLLYAILFALFMVITRLYAGRGARDLFQLYALSFVAVIAGAVVNPAFSFIFTFLGYVVLLTWALILLHLQRDLEALAADDDAPGESRAEAGRVWQARSIVTPRFLLGTSGLALGVFTCSLAIFFFFPRLGMGFFFGQGRQGQQVSGFADQIELGHFGTIKDNLRVVMRVELPDEPDGRQPGGLRLRGISFDHYDGRVWSKTTRRSAELPRGFKGTWRVPTAELPRPYDQRLKTKRLVQDVYLEPLDMDQRMIFGEPRLAELSIDNPNLDRLKRDRTRFLQDAAGDVSTDGRTDTALKYRVESLKVLPEGAVLAPAPPSRGAQADAEIPKPIADLYLQLPDTLDPRVAQLAAEVTRDARTPWDKARAIERHLSRQYTYSTEGGHSRDAPLEDFLFNLRRGHCEYFASAMVILLRTQGIPARPANGFLGGAWNEFGRYYAVRQADAHSWVEAYFPPYGWMTFDPTPAGAALVPDPTGAFAAIDEWFDSLRLSWYKWVVEYNLEKQLDFFREVGELLSGLLPTPTGGSSTSPKAWKQGVEDWANRTTTWVAFGVPLALLLAWRLGLLAALRRRWLLWRLARLAPRPGGPAGDLYRQMLRLLDRQGVGRLPTETPRELATRLTAATYPAAPAVATLTAAYEHARYAETSPPDLSTLTQALETIRTVRLR